MPDKDIMALIRTLEDERPWAALDSFVNDDNDIPADFSRALRYLVDSWRNAADLYDKAKLKGATSTHIVPLRYAAAELDKVVKALDQPRATAAANPAPNVDTCPGCRPGIGTAPRAPHEWICGPGETTAKCLGRPPAPDLGGLNALIESSVAEGCGGLRTEAAAQGLVLDAHATTLAGEPVFTPAGVAYDDSTAEMVAFQNSGSVIDTAATFPGQVTGTEVMDYIKGATNDIPGSQPLQPSSVRSLAELKAETLQSTVTPYCVRCDSDQHRCPGCGEPIEHHEVACPQCNLLYAEPNPHASAEDIADAGLVLDPNGSEHGPDDRNYSLATTPNPESAMQPTYPAPALSPPPFTGGGPGGAVPTTWASDTMTADGHRPPGVPPTPLLGQPGDAGSGYSPTYVPPGGIPMTYAELMSPVPVAILPPHLSHSQIGTIGECPTKYRAQRLPRQGFEQGDTLTEIPQWWQPGGHAFHAFAEDWERGIVSGRPMSDPMSDDQYEGIWQQHFGEQIDLIESTSPVPRSVWRASKGGAEGETWWNANGPLMLKRYVDARKSDEFTWSMPTGKIGAYDLALELERTVDVQTPYGDLPYKAVLDRVRVRQDEGAPWVTLIIDDYKTGDRMPDSTAQLGEYANVLRLLGVPPQVKILGRFFNARKGVWTPEVDLEREGWTMEWFTHLVASGHAGRLALTTGPTPARPSNFCGGCSVRWACPVKGVKVATG